MSTTAPTKIGRIDRDNLRYHGSYPFSTWGKAWKVVMSDVPVDAAYALYDHYVRKTGVLPVPSLHFAQSWEDKHFRILKTEDNRRDVVALYRLSGTFVLIRAATEKYETWAAKQSPPADTTIPYYKEP